MKKKNEIEETDMKTYEVTFYYHTSCTVTVNAKNEEDALAKAEMEVDDDEYVRQILDNITEDADPDIENVK